MVNAEASILALASVYIDSLVLLNAQVLAARLGLEQVDALFVQRVPTLALLLIAGLAVAAVHMPLACIATAGLNGILQCLAGSASNVVPLAVLGRQLVGLKTHDPVPVVVHLEQSPFTGTAVAVYGAILLDSQVLVTYDRLQAHLTRGAAAAAAAAHALDIHDEARPLALATIGVHRAVLADAQVLVACDGAEQVYALFVQRVVALALLLIAVLALAAEHPPLAGLTAPGLRGVLQRLVRLSTDVEFITSSLRAKFMGLKAHDAVSMVDHGELLRKFKEMTEKTN